MLYYLYYLVLSLPELRLIFTNQVYTCENPRIRFHITDKLQHYFLLCEGGGLWGGWGWGRKGRTVICLGCSCVVYPVYLSTLLGLT